MTESKHLGRYIQKFGRMGTNNLASSNGKELACSQMAIAGSSFIPVVFQLEKLGLSRHWYLGSRLGVAKTKLGHEAALA
jgi:hypothetical protein